MHLITDRKPQLANDVMKLRRTRDGLQERFERLIVALEHVTDPAVFETICTDYGDFLGDLDLHGQDERELFHRALFEEVGGSG